MCVDETYIRKLAADACEWQKLGAKLPGSAGEWVGGTSNGIRAECRLRNQISWDVGVVDY